MGLHDNPHSGSSKVQILPVFAMSPLSSPTFGLPHSCCVRVCVSEPFNGLGSVPLYRAGALSSTPLARACHSALWGPSAAPRGAVVVMRATGVCRRDFNEPGSSLPACGPLSRSLQQHMTMSGKARHGAAQNGTALRARTVRLDVKVPAHTRTHRHTHPSKCSSVSSLSLLMQNGAERGI